LRTSRPSRSSDAPNVPSNTPTPIARFCFGDANPKRNFAIEEPDRLPPGHGLPYDISIDAMTRVTGRTSIWGEFA
jgi:hypothetical protein